MSSLPTVTFGSLLRRYRLRAELTQEALAERANLGVETISTLERGTRRAPRQETIALLAEALGLSPAERERLQHVARGQTPASLPTSIHSLSSARETLLPLAGRRQEVAHLSRHLEGSGTPLLLFAGEPGIGKSRLLAEASQRAGAQGWTVLEGGCHRRSGQEPYAPLLGALERRLRERTSTQVRRELEGCAWLVRLLPELAETTLVPAPSWSLPPEQERRLMFAAVSRFLANSAGPAGTLLVLDDLQWAGADALDMLTSLLRAPGEQPLRVVGAYRSTEIRPPDPLGMLVADLTVAGLAAQHLLGPLAPQEARTLLQDLLEEDRGGDSAPYEQLLERTGGIPFFLVNYAQVLRQEAVGTLPQAIPWTVAQSIHQRVAALSELAQELLQAAAVIGRVAPTALLLGLSRHPKADTLAALKALSQARLLLEVEEATQFAHDLIREAVLTDLGPAERRFLHQQVAEALENGPGELAIEQLAYQYLRAGVAEKAALYLEQAGDRALGLHANTEAAGYYQQLRELLDAQHQPREAAGIREKLGDVLILLSRYEEALAALDQAVQAYQAVGEAEGQARSTAKIGVIYYQTGVVAEGIARLEAIVASLQGPRPSHGLAELYTALGSLYGAKGSYRQQLECINLAEQCAPEAYHTPLGRKWRARRPGALILLGDLEAALVVLEELLPEVQASGDAEDQRNALYTLSAVFLARGAYAQERACIEQAMELAEAMGDLAWYTILLHRRGRNAFFQGHWKEARQDMESALSRLRQGSISGHGGTAAFSLGLLSLAEGRWAEARQLFDTSITLATAQGEQLTLRWTQTAWAEWELLQDQPAQARLRLEPLLDRAGEEEHAVTQLLPMLGWAALDLDEIEQASHIIQQAIARAQTRQMRPALADALRIQALVGIRQHAWEGAQNALEEALALCKGMPHPYAEAKELYVYGLLHQAKGEQKQARERLEAALAILNRLGERLYAEKVEHVLAEGRRL